MKPHSIFVIVQPGLEDIAEKEIRLLGYEDLTCIRGGFFLKGHMSTVMKLNLACRVISRVQIEIAEFLATNFARLERQFAQINWQEYITDQNVCIHVSSYQSRLYHEKAIEDRLINSLADILGKTINVVGSPDTENTQLISLYVKRDKFTIRMDTSGAHLHKRGYGTHKEVAPLRETIASALLSAVGFGTRIMHLADPMCGSGTIPIEAVLLAKKVPHCRFRRFSFQNWQNYQPDVFDNVRNELESAVIPSPGIGLKAADVDGKAVQSARTNASDSGTLEFIDFACAPLHQFEADRKYTILTNPPWGKRMDADHLHSVWRDLHKIARKGNPVYLIIPESAAIEFEYRFRTLLRFHSGGIIVQCIKLEA